MEKIDREKLLMVIGKQLRALRRDNKLTIKEIADSCQLTTQAYGNIENGKTDIAISRVIELSNLFNVPITKILNVENNQVNNYNVHNNSGGNNVVQKSESIVNNQSEEIVVMLKKEIEYLRGQNDVLLSRIPKQK